MSVIPIKRLGDLGALAKRANAAHAAGIDRFIEAGRALIDAKAQLQHGEWLPWIEKNLDFSIKTAQRYIRVAQADDPEAQLEKEFSNGPALDLLPSEPPPGGGKAVDESLEDDADDVVDDDDEVKLDTVTLSREVLEVVSGLTDRQWGQLKEYEDERRQKCRQESFAARARREMGAERLKWLAAAIEKFRPWFSEADCDGITWLPREVAIGLYHGRYLQGICRAEAQDIRLRGDLLNDDSGNGILAVLLHECCHLVLPPEVMHRKPFQDLAGAVGLTAPWGNTGTSPELKTRLREIMESLGPLPPLPETRVIPARPEHRS